MPRHTANWKIKRVWIGKWFILMSVRHAAWLAKVGRGASLGLPQAASQSAAIVKWDSLDDGVAFYKSKAWADLAPQREKAVKVIRRYVIEAEK